MSNEPPEPESTGNDELYRFSFEDRKTRALKVGVANFSISADGKKLLLQYAKGKLEIRNAIRARYQPLLKHVQRREDLNDLLVEMIGELQVGHNQLGGGDVHRERPTTVGLLGADFVVDNGHYRIKTIYSGDRWNPFMKAPLAVPGLGVKEGDYILAINGRPVNAQQNLYAFLTNTVDK